MEQHDRIACPELDAIDADDLFAEFAGVGQPIPQSSVEVAVAPSEPSPRDRCICDEWQGYALDHTESCPIRTDAEAAMAEMRQREAEREAAPGGPHGSAAGGSGAPRLAAAGVGSSGGAR